MRPAAGEVGFHRAPGGGLASRKDLCTPAAATAAGGTRTAATTVAVAVGRAEGGKSQTRSEEQTGGKKKESAGVRAFKEIPHTGRSGWLNLLRYWKEGRFNLLHKHMESTFNALGPIYRYTAGGALRGAGDYRLDQGFILHWWVATQGILSGFGWVIQ